MMKLLLLFTSFLILIEAQELLVIADKNFKEENLTVHEIKDIFLRKKRFISGEKILVMNYEFNHVLRRCFEEHILKKTQQSIERYWRRAYYKGKRPPKIVKSTKMLFSYMQEVQPSIGYIDANGSIEEDFKILLRVKCE